MKDTMKHSSRFVAVFGFLLAAAILLGYVEMLIPIQIPIQGVKLGLANAAVLLVLYLFGPGPAFLLSLLRILLSGFLFSNMAAMIYSLAGGMLSLIVMCAVKRTDLFSVVGVSILGAVSHNGGQLVIAMLVLQSRSLVYYIPVLLAAGIVTGMLIGIVVKELLPRFAFLNGGII